jgi:hypothetical protein
LLNHLTSLVGRCVFQGEQQGPALSGQRQMRGAVPAKSQWEEASRRCFTMTSRPGSNGGFRRCLRRASDQVSETRAMVRADFRSIDCRTPDKASVSWPEAIFSPS